MTQAQFSLDISGETCPLTFVKAKLLLDNMAAGAAPCIRLSEGEALDNLPRSLRDQGHSVLELRAETGSGTIYRLLVRESWTSANRALTRDVKKLCALPTSRRRAWRDRSASYRR